MSAGIKPQVLGIRSLGIGFAALFLLVSSSPLLAADLGIRALSEVFWSDAMEPEQKKRLEVLLAGEAGTGSPGLLAEHLERGFPGLWAEGKARVGGDTLADEVEDLLHFALRMSNYQQRRYQYGQDKTIFRLYLSGSLSLLNLGTGETLGSRTTTVFVEEEVLGVPERLSDAAYRDMEARATKNLVKELVLGAKKHLTPETQEAHVAGQHKGRVVLARGYQDGGFSGEVFQVGAGAMLRVTSVQEHLSLAAFMGSGAKPTAGDVVSRVGPPTKGDDAPRLMVFVPDSDEWVVPGVLAGSFGQWFGDALVEAGFTVIPMSDDLVKSQRDEGATIDISSEALEGAMVKPDILVMPQVLRHATYKQRHEEKEADIFILEMVVSCTFIDVATGTVLFGASKSDKEQEILTDWGRQTDVMEVFQKIARRVSTKLASEAFENFKPRRASGSVTGPATPAGEVSWKLEKDIPLGLGTIAEVLMRSKEFKHPQTGASVGFVEEYVGTVRVTGSGNKVTKEVGSVIGTTVPVGPGHRIRAVVGSQGNDDRVIQLGSLALNVVGTNALSEDDVRKIVNGATHTSGHFRTALDNAGRTVLEKAGAELGSGSYVVDDAGDELAMEAATHRVDIRLKLGASELETKGKKLSRSFRADLEAVLVNLETGQGETLEGCKTCPTEVYTMWKSNSFEGRKKKKSVVMGLRDEDAPAHLKQVTFESVQELMRRLRLLSDKARAK